MGRSDQFQNVAVGILAACAVVTTALVARHELTSRRRAPENPGRYRVDARTQKTAQDGGHLIGNRQAALKIVEFADLECPFCARAQSVLDSVMDAFHGRVAVIFRHDPISDLHPHAFRAALSSECAGEQHRFPAFVREIYAIQDSLGLIPRVQLAARAGVRDTIRFKLCLDNGRYEDVIARDARAARRLGVSGTPTFLIGETVQRGLPPDSVLVHEIRTALGERSH